jgi:hypothetical protein
MRGVALAIGVVCAFVTVAVGASPVQADAFAVPCADPRGCPDLLPNAARHRAFYIVDRTFAQTDCAVQEGLVSPGKRTLLRFATEVANVGPGDLNVGRPSDRPDLFEWSACHQHFHFSGFAYYRLWSEPQFRIYSAARDANPDIPSPALIASLGLGPLTGGKRAFCLEDTLRYLPGNLGGPKYTCENQGIQKGWTDIYGNQVDGQWIDVTGVSPGDYTLEVEVNPNRLIEERSYANNAQTRQMTIVQDL